MHRHPGRVDQRNFQSFFLYYRVANLSRAEYLAAPVQVYDLVFRLEVSPNFGYFNAVLLWLHVDL